VQHRHEHVYVETDRHRISGVLTLPHDGYRSRLSDFLNASERDFISLTNCVVELIGREPNAVFAAAMIELLHCVQAMTCEHHFEEFHVPFNTIKAELHSAITALKPTASEGKEPR